MTAVIPAAMPLIGEEERAAVDRVLASGHLTQGPEVAAFEDEFSQIVGGRHCVAVNSGTSALHLALLAMGVKPGDEVVVPSFSFAATANVVKLVGAEPIFVDIERSSFGIDPNAVSAAITPRTVAIMPVHLYGHPAAMDRLVPLAERNGLALIEDACQAHAASLHGAPVGAFGITAAFSLYPTKNMTSGEGGIIVTPDPTLARTMRLLRNQGMEHRYKNEIIGYNNRLTDIHAAIGRVQLEKLPAWTATRQQNAKVLDTGLASVIVPPVAEGAVHVYHQYTVRVHTDRDAFASRLGTHGVGTGVYYPTPIHRLPSFDLALDLPETERACHEVLSLPVHPGLTKQNLEQIIEAVNR